ncbi:MAG: DinB family protein [Acidobacteriia bacterium]|nr:DinB family protein [Terriglobia bacterium]
MVPLSSLHELFDYNYWARDRQLEACAALAESDFSKPTGSSFSSLRDTLEHLVAVEWVWLERWQGRSPRGMPPWNLRTVAALADRWRMVERDMRAWLANLKQEDLDCPLTYTNMKGKQFTYPLGRTVMHLLIHQGYHRGQVTTLLRQLGAQALPVDLLVAYDMGFRL